MEYIWRENFNVAFGGRVVSSWHCTLNTGRHNMKAEGNLPTLLHHGNQTRDETDCMEMIYRVRIIFIYVLCIGTSLIALYAASNSTRKSYEHFRSDDSLNSREYACCMRLECNPSEFSISAINFFPSITSSSSKET